MRSKLFIFGLLLIALGGCGWLDAALLPSTNADGSAGPSQVESIVKVAAPFVPSPWAPLIPTGIGILTTIYAAIRGYNKDAWKKAATSTFEGLEAWLKAHPDQEASLKEFLATNHTAAGVYDFVKATVEKFDH